MKAIFGTLLAFVLTRAFAVEVLIVQQQQRIEGEIKMNVQVSGFLAEELDARGQVAPIVWSVTDPLFRRAQEAGVLGKLPNNPTRDQALDAAKRWGVKYLIYLTAVQSGGSLKASIALYADAISKPIWEDHPQIGVVLGSKPDWESSSRAMAQSWAERLGAGPFRIYPPKPRIGGGAFGDPPRGGDGLPAGADPQAISKAKELLAKKAYAEAIVILRDAIDSKPFDGLPREILASALLASGKCLEAAGEARRAARLASDRPDLFVIAAEAWMLADHISEAEADIKEALARNVDSAKLSKLQGDIALIQDRPVEAVEAYTRSIAQANSPECRYGRAMAYAILGESEKCKADVAGILNLDELTLLKLYRLAVSRADRAVARIGNDLREQIQAARVRPKDPAIIAKLEGIQRTATSLASLLGWMPYPPRHKISHEKRVLAHQLLAQSSGEALSFARTADEDIGDEATLSLGEALKPFVEIRAQYEAEFGE